PAIGVRPALRFIASILASVGCRRWKASTPRMNIINRMPNRIRIGQIEPERSYRGAAGRAAAGAGIGRVMEISWTTPQNWQVIVVAVAGASGSGPPHPSQRRAWTDIAYQSSSTGSQAVALQVWSAMTCAWVRP